MTEGFYQTDFGYKLSYEIKGSGCEHVLFVMGFCCNKAYWGSCVDQIHALYPGKYTTCTYDQRGVGKSTDSWCHKTSSKTLARDILGLLLHLNWIDRKIPLHLVGWSMGGFACIEFIATILNEMNHTLNICSLTLANTGHKLTFPPAAGMYHGLMAIFKGFLSGIGYTRGRWVVPHAVSMHYSAKYLAEDDNRAALEAEYYNSRSPFDMPLIHRFRMLCGHFRAVLTHYVPEDRMKLIRESGLAMNAVVSTDDVLIHPTASINLANSLHCGFSYLDGGHMSHIEHMPDFIEILTRLWDRGLGLKFPHMMRPVAHHVLTSKTFSAPDFQAEEMSLPRPMRSWPDDVDVKHMLTKIMSRMDPERLFNFERLKNPGRLILLPLLLSPLIIRMVSRIRRGDSSKGKLREVSVVLYVLLLLFLVQETARVHG